jgi:hypothetical protein
VNNKGAGIDSLTHVIQLREGSTEAFLCTPFFTNNYGIVDVGIIALTSPLSPIQPLPPSVSSIHGLRGHMSIHGSDGLLSSYPAVVGPGEIPSPTITGPGSPGRPNSRNSRIASGSNSSPHNGSPRLSRMHTSMTARSAITEMVHFPVASPPPPHSSRLTIQTGSSPQLTPTTGRAHHRQSSGAVSLLAATREAAAVAAAEQLVVGSLKGESAAALTAGLKESKDGPPSPPAPVNATTIERRPSATWSPVASSGKLATPPSNSSGGPRTLFERRPSSGNSGTHDRPDRRSSSYGASLLPTPTNAAVGVQGSPRVSPRFATTAYASSFLNNNNNNTNTNPTTNVSQSNNTNNPPNSSNSTSGSNASTPLTSSPIPLRKSCSIGSSHLSAVAAVLAAAAAITSTCDLVRPSTPRVSPSDKILTTSTSLSPKSATSSPRLTPTNSSTATKASHHNIVLARSDLDASISEDGSRSDSVVNNKQVMISYSHKDQDFAKKVAAALKDVIIYYILS